MLPVTALAPSLWQRGKPVALLSQTVYGRSILIVFTDRQHALCEASIDVFFRLVGR